MNLPKKITINNKEYDTAFLSQAARTQLLNIRIAETEMYRLQNQLDMIKTAHTMYKTSLTRALNEVPIVVDQN